MDENHLGRGCNEAVRLGLLCPALRITEEPKASGGASEAIYDAIKSDSSCSVCPCAQYQWFPLPLLKEPGHFYLYWPKSPCTYRGAQTQHDHPFYKCFFVWQHRISIDQSALHIHVGGAVILIYMVMSSQWRCHVLKCTIAVYAVKVGWFKSQESSAVSLVWPK